MGTLERSEQYAFLSPIRVKRTTPEAEAALLQWPQFCSQELCHLGQPHRVVASAIETLEFPAADILAQQELHGLAALHADRSWGIFGHQVHRWTRRERNTLCHRKLPRLGR